MNTDRHGLGAGSACFDLHGTPPGPPLEHGYPHLWPVTAEEVRAATQHRPTDVCSEALGQGSALQRIVANGFAIGMIQADSEAMEAAAFIRDVIRPTHIMELGTCCGGWLYVMHMMSAIHGARISVDMPWERREPKPKWPPKLFRENVPNLLEFFGDIHGSIISRVSLVLSQSEGIDLLFIDADHSYEGTQKHWQMYRPFVRPGGWVGFHDTANGWGCSRFFRELWRDYPNRGVEFIAKEGSRFGIGFVQV